MTKKLPLFRYTIFVETRRMRKFSKPIFKPADIKSCNLKNRCSKMEFFDLSTELSTKSPQNVDNFVENREFLYFSA